MNNIAKKFFIKNIKDGNIKQVTLYGSSMLPTISSNTKLNITNKFDIFLNDIVVADLKNKNVCVIHRVKQINNDTKKIFLCGDNEDISQGMWFDKEDIIAKVINFNNESAVDYKKVNIVIDLPFNKPKSFNARAFDIYQSLINKNKSTYFFDYNIDFNLQIYGKSCYEKYKEATTQQDFKLISQQMTLYREIQKRKFNLHRFTYSNLILCNPTSENEILNTIENHDKTIYFNFYNNKLEELKKFAQENKFDLSNVNIYVSIENFNKLLSGIIFSKILYSQLGIKPILIDNSTLFNGRFNTAFYESFFENIVPSYLLLKDIHTLSSNYNIINFNKYLCRYHTAPIRIMRQCYYKKCLFCDRHSNDNFCFPKQNVVDKIISLYHMNIKNIIFEDDCLVPQQICSILKKLEDADIDIKWQGIFRFDSFLNNEDTIKFLSEHGCKLLFFGLESFSQNLLDIMHKGIKVTDAINILKLCKKYHIKTSVSLLFGFPDETIDDLQTTFNLYNDNFDNIDYFEFNFFIPTKNCKIINKEQGINYFYEPNTIKDEFKPLIENMIKKSTDANKDNSFYLKHYLCWQ